MRFRILENGLQQSGKGPLKLTRTERDQVPCPLLLGVRQSRHAKDAEVVAQACFRAKIAEGRAQPGLFRQT